jgi:hypothetical protein
MKGYTHYGIKEISKEFLQHRLYFRYILLGVETTGLVSELDSEWNEPFGGRK